MSADHQQFFQPDPNSSDLDTQFGSGNRPASGARRATPGEVLSHGFQGAENAGDFLGLDTEFTGSFAPQMPPDPGLSLVGPPTTAPEDAATPSQMFHTPSPAQPGFGEGASAFEYGQDLGEEDQELYGDGIDGEGYEEAAGESSRRPMALAALVAVAGFAAVFFGPTLLEQFRGSKGTDVAQVPPSPRVTTPATGATVPGDTTVDPVSDPLPSVTPVSDPVPEVVDGAPLDSTPSSTQSGSSSSFQRPAPVESDPADQGGPIDQATAQRLAGLLPRPTPQPEGFPKLSSADYEWASEDKLELIWRGESIPPEAIRAPARTLMPRVGNVRVFTTSGDLFDGRLYAVGQNRVWVDTEPGRVGLDGDKVERIEVLPAAAPVHGGERAVPGRRVRVRVPGGTLFGNVLKTEGDEVMLLLEDGGKVRVAAADIEDMGSGRAIVVGR